MNSGQEGASGRPGSPKMEGAGKKGLAAQQQVRGQKRLPQHPTAGARPPRAVGSSPCVAASLPVGRFQL